MLGQTPGSMTVSSILNMDQACVLLNVTQEDPLSTVATLIALTRLPDVHQCMPSVDVSENTTEDDEHTLEDYFICDCDYL